MIKLEDGVIHLTRGDSTNEFNKLVFHFDYYDLEREEQTEYLFVPDDEITLCVMEKKGYSKKEIFKKTMRLSEIGYVSSVEEFAFPLTKEDTMKFPLKNKPQTFWYDVILNDIATIVGYDEAGPKKMIVYPKYEEEKHD